MQKIDVSDPPTNAVTLGHISLDSSAPA